MLPLFKYTAKGPDGTTVFATEEAPTRASALLRLEQSGLTVFELDHVRSTNMVSWWRRELQFSRSNFAAADIAQLCQILYPMLASGHGLVESVSLASEIHSSNKMKEALSRVVGQLENGIGLGKATNLVGGFPADFIIFVGGGSETNKLAENFSQAGKYFDRKAEVQQNIVSSLAYPSFLLLACFGIFMMVTFFLIPTLAEAVVSGGAELSGIIAALLAFRDSYLDWTPWSHLFAPVGLVAIGLLVRGVTNSVLKYVLPTVKQDLESGKWAQTSRVLSALLSSGVPLPDALRNVSKLSSKDSLEVLRKARGRLLNGERSASVFAETPSVPKPFVRLYTFGERANELPQSLLLAADILEQQYDRRLKQLVGAISPAMTLLVGVLVGVLVYAVMSAVLQVGDASLVQ